MKNRIVNSVAECVSFLYVCLVKEVLIWTLLVTLNTEMTRLCALLGLLSFLVPLAAVESTTQPQLVYEHEARGKYVQLSDGSSVFIRDKGYAIPHVLLPAVARRGDLHEDDHAFCVSTVYVHKRRERQGFVFLRGSGGVGVVVEYQ